MPNYNQLNNKYLNTKSRFLRLPSIICSYIVGLIDGTIDLSGLEYEDDFKEISQKMKKILVYNTDNPFGKVAKDLNGNSKIQKDITDSLLITNTKKMEDKYLFNGIINTSIKVAEKNLCFVSDLKATKLGEGLGKIRLVISFTCSDDYDNIKFLEESNITIKRGTCFLSLLDDMLNKHTIEQQEYVDCLGNLTFELFDTYKERVSNTNGDMIYSSVYDIVTPNYRVDDYD